MSRFKGNIAEEKAELFLENQGYEILAKNFYIRGGEIDIIAKKENIIHFVEVKSGIGFEPIFNITPKKLKNIIKTANFYMKKNSILDPFCIDAIIIKDQKIEFLENITF